MPDKTKKIYHALVEGAQSGLTDTGLYAHVVNGCHKATSKKIVKASLLALTDPDLKDAPTLHAIYALAIKHRLDPVSADDQDEAEVEEAPTIKKQKSSNKK